MTQKTLHKVRERQYGFSESDLEGTLRGLLETTKYLIERYGEDAYLYRTTEPYSEYDTIQLFIDREETAEERHQRETKEQEYERKRIELDRQEFERLKKKFGEN